jgi:hypothetical protein
MIRHKVRVVSAVVGATAVLWVSAPAAGAATNLGETFDSPSGCAPNTTYLVTDSIGGAYTVPSDGVISSWSFQTGATAPEVVKLKIGRVISSSDLEATDTELSISGESISQVPSASSLNTFPTRVPVRQGDFLGVYLGAAGGSVQCSDAGSSAGYRDHYSATDVLTGSSATFTGESDGQINVAAVLEPDADQDGFGDETQDQCPSNPATRGQCPITPVTTTVTKKKCKKHKKQHSAQSAKKKKCKKTRH